MYNDRLVIFVKLKSKKFKIELDSEKQITDIVEKLNTQNVIKVGPIIFDRSEFNYMEILK